MFGPLRPGGERWRREKGKGVDVLRIDIDVDGVVGGIGRIDCV